MQKKNTSLLSTTIKVPVGKLTIGGNQPIRIQSMCSTRTHDLNRTIKQIHVLERAGCEIIRVSVPDAESVRALRKIKRAIAIPLVADIHFDHRLAVAAVKQGVDKIRINPGTIGSDRNVRDVISACRDHGVTVRIGVNAGSLKFLKTGQAWNTLKPEQRARHMVAEAGEYCSFCERMNFKQIVVSLKAADIETTVAAYRMMHRQSRYPLHLGITEAGSLIPGIVKSTLGLGKLLSEGIGDTIRISLTADPLYEVKTGWALMQALKLRFRGPEIISCPTCSRCSIDLIKTVEQLETMIDRKLERGEKIKVKKLAVMGCVVNGPGEAKDADIGIAGGKNTGLLFKKGKPVRRVPVKRWIHEIMKEL
ncbi:MAG: flavodoxin-dependent (E)-4-hydroxy-3-methylbut-2-enyl-diphosphate synthase [Elusimicrobia bacterium]|nr:flavodoxin-dependent (E)-4-hydroxy-3-methylbut-2-enyl-diphosphate synthase [Elusimicrobiota bacterium]MBD3411808.1 flavodoxin-dependent (E)-4-hydroxy-3-methylbut-2-enyl-diphosphate synthase [Elusimicrobiota bacterium]